MNQRDIINLQVKEILNHFKVKVKETFHSRQIKKTGRNKSLRDFKQFSYELVLLQNSFNLTLMLLWVLCNHIYVNKFIKQQTVINT